MTQQKTYYKSFGKNMICRDYKYSKDDINHYNGDIRLYYEGLHFTDDTSKLVIYGDIRNTIFAIVEPVSDNIISDESEHCYVTDALKIVKILSLSEILEIDKSNYIAYNVALQTYTELDDAVGKDETKMKKKIIKNISYYIDIFYKASLYIFNENYSNNLHIIDFFFECFSYYEDEKKKLYNEYVNIIFERIKNCNSFIVDSVLKGLLLNYNFLTDDIISYISSNNERYNSIYKYICQQIKNSFTSDKTKLNSIKSIIENYIILKYDIGSLYSFLFTYLDTLDDITISKIIKKIISEDNNGCISCRLLFHCYGDNKLSYKYIDYRPLLIEKVMQSEFHHNDRLIDILSAHISNNNIFVNDEKYYSLSNEEQTKVIFYYDLFEKLNLANNKEVYLAMCLLECCINSYDKNYHFEWNDICTIMRNELLDGMLKYNIKIYNTNDLLYTIINSNFTVNNVLLEKLYKIVGKDYFLRFSGNADKHLSYYTVYSNSYKYNSKNLDKFNEFAEIKKHPMRYKLKKMFNMIKKTF